MDNEWEKILDEQFYECRKMLSDIQIEVKKYSGHEAVGYIKPLRYMMFEALSDLYKLRNDRIDGADKILNT
jgi:hypothetical protein